MDDPVWDHLTFLKNRDRMLRFGLDGLFFEAVKKQRRARRLLSRDHFSVDGTLIEACASVTQAEGRAEWKAALALLSEQAGRWGRT